MSSMKSGGIGGGSRNELLKSFAQSRKEAKSQRNRKCR